jgi:putative oxidoreductase
VTLKSDPASLFEGLPFLFTFVSLKRVILQRLFSTFANGWPGKGLMLLRLAISAFLIYDALIRLQGAGDVGHAIPQMGAAALGILLFAGLWTPVAGMLVSFLQIWICVAYREDLGAHVLAAAIALGLSLIGPGAWSVDALVFGRRRISIQDR